MSACALGWCTSSFRCRTMPALPHLVLSRAGPGAVYFDHAVCGLVRAERGENSISFPPRVGEGKGLRRQSFVGALTAAPLFPVVASALGSGWVSSQSARAAASGSIPIFCHHDDSSPQRWTSRWCVRHIGTVNSSLVLRPSARDCAKCR